MKRAWYRIGAPLEDLEMYERLRARGFFLWVGGPVPHGADAITLGSLVIVRRSISMHSTKFDELLRHEQVHIAQFRELGLARFLAQYCGAYLQWRLRGYNHWGAYRRIPFEIEARWLSSRLPSVVPERTPSPVR